MPIIIIIIDASLLLKKKNYNTGSTVIMITIYLSVLLSIDTSLYFYCKTHKYNILSSKIISKQFLNIEKNYDPHIIFSLYQ